MEKSKKPFLENFKFDRVELAGSFGDLGTLLPIVMGMIMINHLSPSSVFLSFGLLYIVTGFYFKLPVPVQPLKAVGAIAIAYPALITESVIGASGIIFGFLMLLFILRAWWINWQSFLPSRLFAVSNWLWAWYFYAKASN